MVCCGGGGGGGGFLSVSISSCCWGHYNFTAAHSFDLKRKNTYQALSCPWILWPLFLMNDGKFGTHKNILKCTFTGRFFSKLGKAYRRACLSLFAEIYLFWGYQIIAHTVRYVFASVRAPRYFIYLFCVMFEFFGYWMSVFPCFIIILITCFILSHYLWSPLIVSRFLSPVSWPHVTH